MLVSLPARGVSGAELVRDEPFRYGRFEARMQFAAGDGVVSTFFLWKDGSERPDVFWNEIDIEKLGADCVGYSSNALYGLPQSNHTFDVVSTEDLCTGYHTHVVEWTPDYVAWLLDGREVRRNWVSYSEHTPGAGDGGTDFTRVWREDFDGALGAGWSLATWASPFDNSVPCRVLPTRQPRREGGSSPVPPHSCWAGEVRGTRECTMKHGGQVTGGSSPRGPR